MAGIEDLEPLIGHWTQVIDAPRHVDDRVKGEMTLEWLRGEKVVLQVRAPTTPCFPRALS